VPIPIILKQLKVIGQMIRVKNDELICHGNTTRVMVRTPSRGHFSVGARRHYSSGKKASPTNLPKLEESVDIVNPE
jgi:hypothetical protein